MPDGLTVTTGGYSPYARRNLALARYRGVVEQLPEYQATIGALTRGIEAGYEAVPGTFGALEAPAVGAIGRQLEGGISTAREAEMRRRVIGGYGELAGRYAGAGARRGYATRADVGQALAGAPSEALGRGLAGLEVGLERERARQREVGIQAATGLAPAITRGRRGYGAFFGEAMRGQPPYVPYGAGGYGGRAAAGVYGPGMARRAGRPRTGFFASPGGPYRGGTSY